MCLNRLHIRVWLKPNSINKEYSASFLCFVQSCKQLKHRHFNNNHPRDQLSKQFPKCRPWIISNQDKKPADIPKSIPKCETQFTKRFPLHSYIYIRNAFYKMLVLRLTGASLPAVRRFQINFNRKNFCYIIINIAMVLSFFCVSRTKYVVHTASWSHHSCNQ